MVKKAKKRKILRRIGVFFLSLLCFYILATIIYPIDNNNTLILPNWYNYVIVFGPIIVAALYDKLHLTQRIINAIHKKRSEVIQRKKYDSMSEVEKWKMERQAAAKNTKNNLFGAIDLESKEEEHEWRRLQQGLSEEQYELNKIDSMEGHAFEHWCANLLLKNGFTSTEVTPGSGDQGVDIVAVKDGIHYAIQCKCYSSDLGNAPIQQVYAGKEMYGCQIGVVMTNRHFTAGAKQLAEKTRVLLWDREKLTEMLSCAKQ